MGNKLHLWVPVSAPVLLLDVWAVCSSASRRTMERSWDSCCLSRRLRSTSSPVWRPYVLVNKAMMLQQRNPTSQWLKEQWSLFLSQIGYKLSSLGGQPAPLPTVNQEPVFLLCPDPPSPRPLLLSAQIQITSDFMVERRKRIKKAHCLKAWSLKEIHFYFYLHFTWLDFTAMEISIKMFWLGLRKGADIQGDFFQPPQ